MKKYLVSCIAVLTFGLMFVWLALAFSVVDLPALMGGPQTTTGYNILKGGTIDGASSAQNARYVFLLLSVIFGGVSFLAACGACLKAAGVLKVKFDLNMVVVCLLAFTALLAVIATICGFCIEVPALVKDYVKIGAGVILFPVMTILGAVAAFVFRKAK